MRIKKKLQSSFIAMALLFVMLGYVEHNHINKLTSSFTSLDTHTVPSLTLLLEALTSARRSSIKAVEYAMRGLPGDREKSIEAQQELEQQFQAFIKLTDPHHDDKTLGNLVSLKNAYLEAISNYLSASRGPPILQVFETQAAQQQLRIALINQLNKGIEELPDAIKPRLWSIKSEVQNISTSLLEYTLRGQTSDKEKAEQAIISLQQAQQQFLTISDPGLALTSMIANAVNELLSSAHTYLQLMYTRPHSVESIYAEEERVHRTRRALVQALYPLIDMEYEQLNRITDTTTTQLNRSSQLQLLSVLIIALLAVTGGFFLGRSISSPLTKLNLAANRVGNGELEVPLDIDSRDEIGELASSFQRMVSNLKRQRDQVEQVINLRNQELEELRLTQARLADAQQMAHLGHYDRDILEDRITGSPEMYRILGLEQSTGHLSFEQYIQIVHPDDRADRENVYLQSVQNKSIYSMQYRLLMQDGRTKFVRIIAQHQYAEDGQHIKDTGTIQDITDTVINESINNRFESMLEHSIEEIYIFDADSLHFLQVSRGALINLGYDIKEMYVRTPVDIKPDYEETEFREFIEPLRTGQVHQLVFETRHQRKDGSNYPVEIHLLYSDEKPTPIFLAIVLDLSERKRIDNELTLHRQHLEDMVAERTATIQLQSNIIDQAHDAIVTTDSDGIITSWNRGAEQLFGYQSETAIGQHVSMLHFDNRNEMALKDIFQTLAQQGQLETEVTITRQDGSAFPALISLSCLYNEDGSLRGTVGFTIDLSEQKSRERELNLLTQQLQDTNRELEAFSYSVSHDLRSPLRSIDGFSLALLDDYGDQLDNTAKDYLKRVRSAAQRMGMLIDDLLELSRVNRSDLNIEKVDLRQMSRSIYEELSSTEPARDVELILGDNMTAEGDPRLLRMVMDNLIGNAWKFTARQKKAKIVIKPLAEKPSVFYIKDNGVGFDMRHADKLFGVFQRLHQVTEFPGTGVGLATVQRIIHRHGGKIWAESAPGEGSSFFFTFKPADD